MALHRSFSHIHRPSKTHSWTLCLHDPVQLPLNDLAAALADRIVSLRCQPSPLYDAWRKRVDGGPAHSTLTRAALEAFVGPAVGLPSAPIPQDHLEGMVAEYLWYVLTVDGGAADSVFKVHPPGFLATSPGGDGLVIHRDGAGPTYRFRLWELKKCTGRKTVGGTVSMAFTQLEAKGARYLAQFTSIGQETDDPELAALYGNLVEGWLAGDRRASAGVAVHTSTPKVPRRCFTRFGQRFARFTDPSQLKGLVTAVDDFTAFAERVRAVIWTGL